MLPQEHCHITKHSPIVFLLQKVVPWALVVLPSCQKAIKPRTIPLFQRLHQPIEKRKGRLQHKNRRVTSFNPSQLLRRLLHVVQQLITVFQKEHCWRKQHSPLKRIQGESKQLDKLLIFQPSRVPIFLKIKDKIKPKIQSFSQNPWNFWWDDHSQTPWGQDPSQRKAEGECVWHVRVSESGR